MLVAWSTQETRLHKHSRIVSEGLHNIKEKSKEETLILMISVHFNDHSDDVKQS